MTRSYDFRGTGAASPAPPPYAEGALNLSAYESALKDASIPQIEKNVFRYIIFRCRAETGLCFFTLNRASEELGISRSRISRAIRWLREKNHITTKFNGKLLVFELCSTDKPALPQEHSSFAPRTNRTRRELANGTFPPHRVPEPEEPLSPTLQAAKDRADQRERKNNPEQLELIREREKHFQTMLKIADKLKEFGT